MLGQILLLQIPPIHLKDWSWLENVSTQYRSVAFQAREEPSSLRALLVQTLVLPPQPKSGKENIWNRSKNQNGNCCRANLQKS